MLRNSGHREKKNPSLLYSTPKFIEHHISFGQKIILVNNAHFIRDRKSNEDFIKSDSCIASFYSPGIDFFAGFQHSLSAFDQFAINENEDARFVFYCLQELLESTAATATAPASENITTKVVYRPIFTPGAHRSYISKVVLREAGLPLSLVNRLNCNNSSRAFSSRHVDIKI